MIFVSSSCIKTSNLVKAVEQLVQTGFRNIELSGGTNYYEGLEEDLLELKAKYGIRFLCHNYFPPPPVAFVVNLASLDPKIAQLSIEHLQRSLALTQKLGEKMFGFHAGFLMNIPLDEVGKSIAKQELFEKNAALQVFCDRFIALQQQYPDIDLYIENNVISNQNLVNFAGVNPLFMTDHAGYLELHDKIRFKPLLDIAHLKVSCRSLNLDLQNEMREFMALTDYIHISDNDGLTDSNGPLLQDSAMYDMLQRFPLLGKTFTLEVYSGEKDLVHSYEAVLALAEAN